MTMMMIMMIGMVVVVVVVVMMVTIEVMMMMLIVMGVRIVVMVWVTLVMTMMMMMMMTMMRGCRCASASRSASTSTCSTSRSRSPRNAGPTRSVIPLVTPVSRTQMAGCGIHRWMYLPNGSFGQRIRAYMHAVFGQKMGTILSIAGQVTARLNLRVATRRRWRAWSLRRSGTSEWLVIPIVLRTRDSSIGTCVASDPGFMCVWPIGGGGGRGA
jgi:hypothetical protein